MCSCLDSKPQTQVDKSVNITVFSFSSLFGTPSLLSSRRQPFIHLRPTILLSLSSKSLRVVKMLASPTRCGSSIDTGGYNGPLEGHCESLSAPFVPIERPSMAFLVMF